MIYVLFFLVAIALVLNRISKSYVLHDFSYSREISKKTVEIDEEFEIATVAENNKLLPITFLQIIEKLPQALKYRFKAGVTESGEYIFHKMAMMMLPYQRIKRVYKVFCSQRGRFIFRDVTLIAGDMLGLNTTAEDREHLQEVVALPEKADLEEAIMPYGNCYGDISVRRWIIDDPILTVGIREYTGSEPFKTIHWPSSLKSGSLMVKKFDYTTDNTVMIALNIESSKPFWSGMNVGKIEKCISIARGVVEHFEEAGIPYGLACDAHYDGFPGNENIGEAGFGKAHYSNTVENLGRIGYSIAMPFEELLNSLMTSPMSFTTFVIITPAMLEEYIMPINRLRERSMKTVVISMDKNNLSCLSGDILTYIERGSSL